MQFPTQLSRVQGTSNTLIVWVLNLFVCYISLTHTVLHALCELPWVVLSCNDQTITIAITVITTITITKCYKMFQILSIQPGCSLVPHHNIGIILAITIIAINVITIITITIAVITTIDIPFNPTRLLPRFTSYSWLASSPHLPSAQLTLLWGFSSQVEINLWYRGVPRNYSVHFFFSAIR